MPQISIIVPVYNVEQYLSKCIESLIGQTYHNIEIILVDDGSTDASGRLCDEYALRDDRIRVIHFPKNLKQGEARNAGLDLARGEYISFVDADDYIETDTYESAYQTITKYSADICIFAIRVLHEDGSITFTNGLGHVSVFTKAESIRSFLSNENIITDTCVNKLYVKQLFASVRFKKGIIFEDNEITYRLLEKADKCVHTGLWKYNYIKRKGSTMQQPFNRKSMAIIPINRERIAHIKNNHPDLLGPAISHYVTSLVCTVNHMIASGNFKTNVESAQQLSREIETYASEVKKGCGLKRHCQITLICRCMPLYCLVWSFALKLRKLLRGRRSSFRAWDTNERPASLFRQTYVRHHPH